MLISVIIPVYNVSNYIERCLQSVLEQTYKDIEIIVVDDASPDNSMVKAHRLLKNVENNVKIVSHPSNRGLSAARNSGVKNSTGDYLYFLDSDDEIPPTCIEALVSYIKEDFSPDVIMGEMETIGAERKNFPQLRLNSGTILYKEEIIDSYLKGQWYEMACNKLVKRDLFFEKDCWFYEGILHEDTLWSFKLSTLICSLVVCKDVTYYYYIHPNSITQKKNIKNFDSMFLVIEQICDIRNKLDSFSDRLIFNQYVQNIGVFILKSIIVSRTSKIYAKSMLHKLNQLFAKNNLGFSSWKLACKWFILSFYIKFI